MNPAFPSNRSKSDTRLDIGLNKKAAAALLIFLLALGIRLYYLENLVMKNHVRGDAARYMGYAINLVQNGVYSQDWRPAPEPDSHVPPGYPLFLAAVLKLSPDFEVSYVKKDDGKTKPALGMEDLKAFQSAIDNALAFQAVLGGLTASICFFVGLFFLPFGAAVCAAVLTAVSPHLIMAGGFLLTETLFTLLLMISMWTLFAGFYKMKGSWLLAASFSIGIASLVRPALLLFPVFIVPAVFLYWDPKKRIAACILLVAGTCIIWSSWTIWSATTANSGQKRGLALASFALGMHPDLIYKDPAYKGSPYADPENTQFEKLATDAEYALKTLWRNTVKNPGVYLKWYLWGKPSMFWSWKILKVGYQDIFIYKVSESMYDTSKLAKASLSGMRILHPILTILAVFGFVFIVFRLKTDSENKKEVFTILIFFLLMIYFTAVHTILAPLPRYSIPLRPALHLTAFVLPAFLLKLRTGY